MNCIVGWMGDFATCPSPLLPILFILVIAAVESLPNPNCNIVLVVFLFFCCCCCWFCFSLLVVVLVASCDDCYSVLSAFSLIFNNLLVRDRRNVVATEPCIGLQWYVCFQCQVNSIQTCQQHCHVHHQRNQSMNVRVGRRPNSNVKCPPPFFAWQPLFVCCLCPYLSV